MLGTLQLVKIKEVHGVPVAELRLWSGADAYFQSMRMIMEYELPTNFSYNPQLTETFSALHLKQEQFVGFLFLNKEDRDEWDRQLETLSKALTLTND